MEDTLELGTYCDRLVTLTTQRAESSYGIPVAVIDGVAYGKRDIVPAGPDETEPLSLLTESAGLMVAHTATRNGLREHPLVKSFMRDELGWLA